MCRFYFENTFSSGPSMHNGEKPFQCDLCVNCFAYITNLIVHWLVHSGHKSFNCNKYDKCFASKSALVNYPRIHTSEKSHQSFKCVARSGHPVRHHKTHDGERSLQWDHSDK